MSSIRMNTKNTFQVVSGFARKCTFVTNVCALFALSLSQVDELRMELNKKDQEMMAMGAKMKTLEEQHHDYQRHISVLKESLVSKEEHYNMLQNDLEELRHRLEEKNKLIEKKTQAAIATTSDKNKLTTELQELRDHIDIKDKKISVLTRKIDNLNDLINEKNNQLEALKMKLNAIQEHHSTSEGTVLSLEDAIADKDKQILQLKEQRDRAEAELREEREVHEKELTEYRMKLNSMESENEKLQVNNESQSDHHQPIEAIDGHLLTHHRDSIDVTALDPTALNHLVNTVSTGTDAVNA